MDIYPHTGIVLTAVILFLIPEPCTTDVTAEVTEANCPRPMITECRKGIRLKRQYLNVKSRKFGTNFLCDTKTDGGGWIVFQRRVSKETEFDQHWETYKNGFGPVCGDYWLGNHYIYEITHSGKYELRIDMNFKSKNYFAQYKDFYIDDERKNYTLHVSGFTGNTNDEFSYHNKMQFSARDRDNDDAPKRDCSRGLKAGWWYGHHQCYGANLNGHNDLVRYYAQAIHWYPITGNYATLDAVEMKIRQRKN